MIEAGTVTPFEQDCQETRLSISENIQHLPPTDDAFRYKNAAFLDVTGVMAMSSFLHGVGLVTQYQQLRDVRLNTHPLHPNTLKLTLYLVSQENLPAPTIKQKNKTEVVELTLGTQQEDIPEDVAIAWQDTPLRGDLSKERLLEIFQCVDLQLREERAFRGWNRL